MKIFDKFGNEHKSVDEALAAERAYDKKVAEEAKLREELKAKRAERAKEVEAAKSKMVEAKTEYFKLVEAFCRDYGSYHTSIHYDDANKLMKDAIKYHDFDIDNSKFEKIIEQLMDFWC